MVTNVTSLQGSHPDAQYSTSRYTCTLVSGYTRLSPSSLQLDLRWIVAPNLHNRLPRPLTHNRTNIPHIPNLPNALGRFGQIPNILPRLRLKQPDSSVVSARHEEVLVELESGHGRIVSGDALEDGVGFEGECYDTSIRASCRQDCR